MLVFAAFSEKNEEYREYLPESNDLRKNPKGHFTHSGALTCKAVEDDDLLRLAGFREIRYDSVSMEFRGDLMKKITLRTAEKDREATSKTFHSMVDWATRERHSEIVKLVSGGKFAYNARNAEGWLALMKEWLRTKDKPTR